MAPKLLNEMLYRGKNRMDRELVKATKLLEESSRENFLQNFIKGTNLLVWGKEREKRMAGSLEEIISKKKNLGVLFSDYSQMLEESTLSCLRRLRRYYEYKCRDLNIPPLKELPRPQKTSWEKEIPFYNPEMEAFPGCFRNYRYFEEKLGAKFLEKYKGVGSAFQHRNRGIQESFNFINGQNSVSDIYQALEAELWSEDYKPSPYTYLSFEAMTSYFQLLQDAKVISFKK
jgi:hypothetical protein